MSAGEWSKTWDFGTVSELQEPMPGILAEAFELCAQADGTREISMRNLNHLIMAIAAICAVAISGCATTPILQDLSDDATTGSDTTSTDTTTADNGCACPLLDLDGDGFCTGNAAVSPSCPKGGGDCDDTPATGFNVHPGAPEICGDGKDNNCNNVIDDGCGTTGACNANTPGFGTGCSGKFGVCAVNGVMECNTNGPGLICSTEIGGTKCVGTKQEICGNGLDDDCNGQTDENCGAQTGGNGNNWFEIDTNTSADRVMTIEWSTTPELGGPYWKHQFDGEGFGTSVTSYFTDPDVKQGQLLHFYVNYTYKGLKNWACSDNRPQGQERDPSITGGKLHVFGSTIQLSATDFTVTQSEDSGCSLRFDLQF